MIMLFKGNSSRLEHVIEKLQASNNNTSNSEEVPVKDALGTTPGSSWRSSTPEGGSRSPASTASERELTFTLGATEHTPYQCQFCDKAFPRLSYLKKHEQSHSDQMPFRCDFCSRLFKHKRSRDRHVKLHTGDRKYRCAHCEAAFSRSDHLKIHMKTHDNQKPFQCTVCNRGYNTAAALTSHMQNHKRTSENGAHSMSARVPAGAGYRCLHCGERFRRSELLQNHMSTAHPSEMSAEDAVKPTLTPPSHHPLTKLACIYCTRDSFSNMEQLQVHVRAMHGALLSGDLPASPAARNGPSPASSLHYPCDMCTMRFPTGPALLQHAAAAHGSSCASPSEQLRPTDLSKKSNGKRPRSREDGLAAGTLLCNQCGAALPDFEAFRVHVRSHLDGAGSSAAAPPADNASAVACAQCGARFNSGAALERHAAAHLLALGSEFGCPSCARAFSKPDDLQKHLMDLHAHHLYRCAICSEIFDSKVAIQVHFAVKHSHECKVYRCTMCTTPTVSFRTEAEFAMHVRNQHPQHSQQQQQQQQQHSTGVRCLFCRVTCSSDLEMQFHLATHADHFRCPICREGFHVEFLLDRHMQTHHGPQTLNGSSSASKHPKHHQGRSSSKSASSDTKKEGSNCCDICDRSDFQSESELLTHRKLVHHAKGSGGKNGAVSLSCAYCSENCKSRAELENHMKSHSQGGVGGGKHKCLICDEVFPSTAVLAEHKLTHCKVVAGNSCTQCKLTLANEEQFFAHLSQHSNNNNNNSTAASPEAVALPTPCVVCRQTLLTELEARIHARFHLKNSGLVAEVYQCALCLKSFELHDVIPTGGERNNGVATTHVCRDCYRHHSGLKPDLDYHQSSTPGMLECKLCRRSLATAALLQTHLVEHTFAGCAAFTCYLCSAVFTAAAKLQQHMLAHGLSARPYDCARCGCKFFFRAELDHHTYAHLDDDLHYFVKRPSSPEQHLAEPKIESDVPVVKQEVEEYIEVASPPDLKPPKLE